MVPDRKRLHMKRITSRKPSPALVIACIALFASLGGVSYAVATGSITSREIRDNTIQGQDIRANAVTASEIKKRSLDGTDIRINRVGGNAVKEEVLEVGKLKKVPSAAAADVAANGTRWALVNDQGQIVAQTGGFTIVNCYDANANCYIDAGSDVTNKGVHAQIVTSNNPDSGTDDQLSGSTSASPCFFDFVNCGPPGTDDSNGGSSGVFVVTPRNADGTDPGAGDRYPFYAFVTGPGN